MRVAADRLSIRWYLGYDFDERLPHHSSLSRIRQRYGLEVFRAFFDEIVVRCIEAGLVWGEECAPCKHLEVLMIAVRSTCQWITTVVDPDRAGGWSTAPAV
jgi:hypothetical protein